MTTTSAYDLGYEAAQKGDGESACHFALYSPARDEWFRGYYNAIEDSNAGRRD